MGKKEAKSKGKTRPEAAEEKEAQQQERAETKTEQEVREQLEAAVSETKDTSSVKKASALAGAAKAIEKGAGLVGEKAPEVMSTVLHTVKKGATVAYGAGSTFVRKASQRAKENAETYRHRAEIRKLQARRDALTSKLGSIVYSGIAVDNESPESLLTSGEITALIEEIGQLDIEVIKAGQALEKH